MNSTDTNPNSEPLIDVDQLNASCDGDAGLIRELMDMYFTQAGEIMSGLRTAVAGKSVVEVKQLSHKLAGSSLACGLVAIVPSLRRMESNAKDGHLDGADESLAEAEGFLEQLRGAVQDHLRQAQTQ